MKIYIAGALFNEGEIRQRIFEEEQIKKLNLGIEVYNPITAPFNQDKNNNKPTPKTIFEGDFKEIQNCDIILADITNEDAGVMCEIGIGNVLNKTIIAVNSDIRLASASSYDIPSYGINHFVLGAILDKGYFVTSFDEALEIIKSIKESK